jgi:hypothetical protein
MQLPNMTTEDIYQQIHASVLRKRQISEGLSIEASLFCYMQLYETGTIQHHFSGLGHRSKYIVEMIDKRRHAIPGR